MMLQNVGPSIKKVAICTLPVYKQDKYRSTINTMCTLVQHKVVFDYYSRIKYDLNIFIQSIVELRYYSSNLLNELLFMISASQNERQA